MGRGREHLVYPRLGATPDWKLTPGTTWQVRRSHFDGMMLEEAEKRGANVIRGKAVKPLLGEDGGVRGVTMRRPDGSHEDIEAEVTLDCSGLATFLANQRATGPKYVGNYDKQVAFFSHATGAIRGDGSSVEEAKNNTLIFYLKKFHWAWFIPIDDEVVSLGLVVPTATFQESRQTPEEFFRSALPGSTRARAQNLRHTAGRKSARNSKLLLPGPPLLRKRFYLHRRRASFHRSDFFLWHLSHSARSRVCCASCAGISRGQRTRLANPFAEHMLFCEKGTDNLEDMVDLFWEQPFAFAGFVHLRYREQMIDAFAGRVYETEHQPSPAILAFRKMLKRTRDYDHEDDYSVPIGSRFHPERAAIWEPNSPLSTTEEWMLVHSS